MSESLKFTFTPVDGAKPAAATSNPHAKSTTETDDDIAALKEKFGNSICEVSQYAGERTVRVTPEALKRVVYMLRDELAYNYLADIAGIDRFTDEDRYAVVYNIVSISRGKRFFLMVWVDESDMSLDSITDVYKAANWNEREVYDMFGIVFAGHPDPRRMFMPEDFEHHPLRKEFPLLGIPGSLPLPPNTPEGALNYDPFSAAHGNKPSKSYEEPVSAMASKN